MTLVRFFILRTNIRSIASLKCTVLWAIALFTLSACSSGGVESTTEPEIHLFNQSSSIDTNSALTALNDEQVIEDTSPSDAGSVSAVSATDAGPLMDKEEELSIPTVLNEQTSESANLTIENNPIEEESALENFITQIELSQQTSSTLVLPVDGEIPTTQIANVLSTNTPAADLISALETTSSIVLADFNSKLSSGEELSHSEENCLYDYDQAEGKPLLGLHCSSSINLDRSGVLSIQEAVFLSTDSCANALSSMELGDCELHAATLEIKAHNDSLIEAESDNDRQLLSSIPERPALIERPRPTAPEQDALPERPSSSDLSDPEDATLNKPSSTLDRTQPSVDSETSTSAEQTNASEQIQTTQTPALTGDDSNQILTRPTPDSITNQIEKPSDPDQPEDSAENSSSQRPSISDIRDQLADQINSTLESERPGLTIESSDPSNIAISTELSAQEISEQIENAHSSVQYHPGATIQYGVNGSELVVDFRDASSRDNTTSNCTIDVSTGELTNGGLEDCDEEFTRLSERLRFILSVITDDSSSL